MLIILLSWTGEGVRINVNYGPSMGPGPGVAFQTVTRFTVGHTFVRPDSHILDIYEGGWPIYRG